jgi:hypothetical protein
MATSTSSAPAVPLIPSTSNFNILLILILSALLRPLLHKIFGELDTGKYGNDVSTLAFRWRYTLEIGNRSADLGGVI